jgi:protein involved in polysaccharide export with SLBB domain
VSRSNILLPLLASLCLVLGAPAHAEGDDYLLDSGDRVRVRVQEWPDVTGEFLVGADGSVSVPGVGPVRARGISPNALAQAISDRLRERAPSTNSITVVDIIRYRSIYVLGDVQRPGEYEFQPNLTVTRAISLAGGFYRPPVAGFQRFERDAILSRGEAATFAARADRLRIRLARLQAELKDSDDIEIPAVLARRQERDAIADMLAEARTTLKARRDSFRKQTEGFSHAKTLLDQEIASLTRQIEAETRQLDYVRRELDKMRNLAERGLASSPRMLDLERNTAQITGARQALETSIVRSRAEMHKLDQRIADIKNEIADKIREEIEKVNLELVDATGKVQTSLMLANEAETLGPEALMRQEAEDPQHRFVIVRRAPDGVQKELTTHRHGSLQPGDVVEIVKVLRDPARKDSTAAVR